MPQSRDALAETKALRSAMRARRHSLTPEERRELSLAAARHLCAATAWLSAECVALFVSMPDEIDTSYVLEHAWSGGKRVLLPLCDTQEPGRMRLMPCSGPEKLRPGAYGILEPVPDEHEAGRVVPQLILTPGLVFDHAGHRLGMGGGYYDRLFALPEYETALRIGFAYSFQCVEHLESAPWDKPVQALCTEQGILWTP